EAFERLRCELRESLEDQAVVRKHLERDRPRWGAVDRETGELEEAGAIEVLVVARGVIERDGRAISREAVPALQAPLLDVDAQARRGGERACEVDESGRMLAAVGPLDPGLDQPVRLRRQLHEPEGAATALHLEIAL